MLSIRMKTSKDEKIGEFNCTNCCDDVIASSNDYGYDKWKLFIEFYCPLCNHDIFIDKIAINEEILL